MLLHWSCTASPIMLQMLIVVVLLYEFMKHLQFKVKLLKMGVVLFIIP